MIEVKNLFKSYGDKGVLSDINLTIKHGDTLAIVGKSGAGKTTLLDIISGITKPDGGKVTLYTGDRRIDITGKPISKITMLGVARAFQIPNVFDGLTVMDNMRTALIAGRGLYRSIGRDYASLEDISREAYRILELVGLDDKGDVPAANLSHGERKLLDIAMALTIRPRILLLDEPTSGLSTVEKDIVVDLIRSLKRKGIPMLVVEHDLDVVFSIADRVIAMHEGKVLVEGRPSEVREDPRLKLAYFGE